MSITDTLLGSVLRGGLTWLGRRRLPQTSGVLRLPGLHGPVEAIRDRWGVPHIYAVDAHDLLFGQGFVHAQDRLWQMELNRRTANGRLSELFGLVALDTDRATRTFGFRRLGEADWQASGEDMRGVLEAYTHGVNAIFDSPTSHMPVEFTLLGHKPEPWTPLDSLAWSRVMIWQLSHAWYGEILRAKLIEAVGLERAAAWEIHHPPTLRQSSRRPSNSIGLTPTDACAPHGDPTCSAGWAATAGPWRAPRRTPASRICATTCTWRWPCRRSGTRSTWSAVPSRYRESLCPGYPW
jgi:acyl-homoserine lactone acylase PvdQ